MKTLLLTILTAGALLLGPSGAAALSWLGDYNQFVYSVANDGVCFSTAGYINSNIGADDSLSSGYGDSFTGTAWGEANLYTGFPGSMSMIGMARGASGAEGITVYGATGILQDGLTTDHGIDVTQNITSTITRRFTVADTAGYRIRADLDGTVAFQTFAGDSYYYGTYDFTSLSAPTVVSLEAYADINGSITQLGVMGHTMVLDENNRSQEMTVTLSPQINGNDVSYYQLTAALNISTDVQNYRQFDWYVHPDGISQYGDWLIGATGPDAGNPGSTMALSATVSAAPIPGSVLLMLSGLGGLACIRRRFRG
jgi:hypothetical protein